MDNVWVNFSGDDGYAYELGMPLDQLQFIVATKPLIDGNEGNSVYEIEEFRYDPESEQFTFWLKKWEPVKGVPYFYDPNDA